LALLLATMAVAGQWKEMDRVALIVGDRPVPLSEVRAYVWLHAGQVLPEQVNEQVRSLVSRMERMEQLYESRRRYGTDDIEPRWMRLAVHFLANSGFPALDPAGADRPVVSGEMVRRVFHREMTVLRFVQGRTGGLMDDPDALSGLMEREAADIRVTNYLY